LADTPARIVFYVQHLLGIGHLYRARRICDALHDAGAELTLVSGGVPARALDNAAFPVVQLPPICSGDAGFSGLVDETGQLIDDSFKQRRRDALLAAIRDIKPHAIITEAFPFGRRQVRFELIPLLEHVASTPAATRPFLIASIRDLLQEGRKPERNKETVEILNRHYDAVLVHGDSAVSTLADTFPNASDIDIAVHDTGLVAPPAPLPVPLPSDIEPFDIIVSAGGGAVGRTLLMSAAQAAANGLLPGDRIALVTGPNAPRDLREALQQASSGRATVLPYIADLCVALSKARLSVSQAGYNTVADILVAGCAAVLVPFAEGGETEQTRRARALHDAGRAVMLVEHKITPQSLADAARQALDAENRRLPVSLEGAATAAKFVLNMIDRSPRRPARNVTDPE
jgi:predicted glycosyltransferase